MPYGIMVDPETKDIYITDAGNYVTPGALYCFDNTGRRNGATFGQHSRYTSHWFHLQVGQCTA